MTDMNARAVEFLKGELETEIEYLISEEGYIDDRAGHDDDFDQDEDFGVTEADTVMFYQELIEKVEAGWVPTSFEEIHEVSMEYYTATQDSPSGYGDSDGTDHIAASLAEIFELDEEMEDA